MIPWPRGLAAEPTNGNDTVTLTWTGLYPGTTNVVELARLETEAWQINLVFTATGVTHTVTLPTTATFRLKSPRR